MSYLNKGLFALKEREKGKIKCLVGRTIGRKEKIKKLVCLVGRKNTKKKENERKMHIKNEPIDLFGEMKGSFHFLFFPALPFLTVKIPPTWRNDF